MAGAWAVRPLVASDWDAVAGVLNGWFAAYLDHLDYRRGVLDYLDGVLGWTDGPSVVAEGPDGLVGVLVGGFRRAVFDGASLRVVNLGVLAVHPGVRRQGLAGALEAAFAARSLAGGADLISLVTQEVYRSHQFYAAAGYRVVERFQPLGAAIGEVERLPGLLEVDGPTFRRLQPRLPARPGVITEVDVAPSRVDHPDVPVRYFLGGRAGAAVAAWPARVRVEGTWRYVRSAQLLEAFGDGVALQATVAGALAWAKAAGCDGVLAMPTVRSLPPGFTPEGGSWTLRYARGLTPAGEAAVAAARAYDEVCPAP